jgi:hypothetical protein
MSALWSALAGIAFDGLVGDVDQLPAPVDSDRAFLVADMCPAIPDQAPLTLELGPPE